MNRTLTIWAGRALVHSVGTLCLAVAMFWLTIGWSGAQSLATALGEPHFHFEWWRLGLIFGLAACLWALVVIAVLWVRESKQRSFQRVVSASRGTVMTETLIILVPFLLLTSGLAQLAILEMSVILGHVAAYQGARTAWVWFPETTRPGRTTSTAEIQNRARIAVALVMTPTAPEAYQVGAITNPAAVRNRNFMRAYFEPGFVTGSAAGVFTSNLVSADHVDLTYHKAYDTGTMQDRASRKFSMAYHATNVSLITGGQVGIQFTYQQNCVFPWFAYIWGGGLQTIGGRSGYYTPINRRYTIAAQVLMN